MKKRIILITNSFPFGTQEASFLRPELPYLLEKYDLTILTKNSTDQMTTELDGSIDIFRYRTSAIGAKDIVRNIRWIFSKDFFDELVQNLKNKKNILSLIKFVIRAYHFARYAESVRKKYRQPVLYYCFWNDYTAYGISKLCEANDDKCISRIHGGDLYRLPSNNFFQPLKKTMAMKFDKIIFISNAGKQYYLDNYHPASKDNRICCYMGIDNQSGIRNQPSTDGVIRLVSVSNINEGKRIDRIAAALALISDIKIEWTHIGDGEAEQFVKEQTEKYLSGRLNITYRFLGRISNAEVKKYYQEENIDALLNVSISEGLPVSMMEAASYGVILIGTNVGGVSEIIKKDNGFLIEKDFTNEDLANVIVQLSRLDNRSKTLMRENSYKIWKDDFNATKNYNRFIEEVESV